MAVGLALVAGLCLLALLAPVLATHDPQQTDTAHWLEGPSREHYFGTDRLGRDIFSRVLYGGRISLAVGALSMLLSVGIGILAGAAAGYYGGLTDVLLMRLTDIVLVFPSLLLVLTLVALFEPALWLVILVIGGTGWPGVARLVRSEILRLRQSEFVASARMLGAGGGRIMRRHLLPNALGPVLVAATLAVPHAIMTEAGLGFFGLGVQPPTPTWGNMLRDAQLYLRYAWWYATFPGLFIFLAVFAFHLTGEGLRRRLGLSAATGRRRNA
ncbi:MAG TPA: ABC transporter permease [Firmicutes bacterium]|nr:ABC transporter permease [Bacillota bacterium]